MQWRALLKKQLRNRSCFLCNIPSGGCKATVLSTAEVAKQPLKEGWNPTLLLSPLIQFLYAVIQPFHGKIR
jgi:hypothetical protein